MIPRCLLVIFDSELHWEQSAHKDSPSQWKVQNYSPDKHKYTWAGPQANLHLRWTRRLYVGEFSVGQF